MRSIYIPMVLVILLMVCAGSGNAQTITINNDLSFGNVFPGIPKVVSKATAGSAAEFHVSGTAGNEVTIDFTLPTYMNLSGANMQMIFHTTDCAVDSSASPDQSNPGADNLNPWHTITYRLGSTGLTIWLGGTVVPKLIQTNGSYAASIVLTVAYTGS